MSSAAIPVRYGATLKLRHRATGGALRSYPFVLGRLAASGQATVTCGAVEDDSDQWRVKSGHRQPPEVSGRPVEDGEIVRFEHVASGKHLHSHAGFPSPVSGQQEVTCFGEEGSADDDWRVEVEGGGSWDSGKLVRLVHLSTGQALHSHVGFEHPQWTMGQQEVTCSSERDAQEVGNDLWLASDFLARGACFVSQVVPTTIEIGQSLSLTLTMRNVGTETWTPERGYRLGAPAAQDRETWGRDRVEVIGSIAPGAEATFTFSVTAPAARGLATLQWRMLQEGTGWFGEHSTLVKINVVLPGGPATVPDVRQAVKVAAISAIRAAGLEPRLTGSTGRDGLVASQSPPPHSVVDRGSTVVLHLTTGES